MSIFDLTSISRGLGIMLEDNLNGDDNDDTQQQNNTNDDEFNMEGNDGGDEPAQEGDPEPQADTDEPDNPDDGSDEFTMDDNDDTGEGDTGDDTQNQDGGYPEGNETEPVSDEEGDEFSMDGDDDGDDGGGGDSETEPTTDTGDDSTGTDSNDDIDSNDPNAKLKALEKSIFDSLSPEQQQAKIKELKVLYNDVHIKSQSVIDMITNTTKDPIHAKVYDYVMNSLLDLQRYIKDYLMNIFDSKTYIENLTELEKYLAILNTVSNVFDEVKKDSETNKE